MRDKRTEALNEIAALRGQCLLGSPESSAEFREGFQTGSNRAFDQCAALANEALPWPSVATTAEAFEEAARRFDQIISPADTTYRKVSATLREWARMEREEATGGPDDA